MQQNWRGCQTEGNRSTHGIEKAKKLSSTVPKGNSENTVPSLDSSQALPANSEPPTKQARLDLAGTSQPFYGETVASSSEWTEVQQQEFAANLCRLVVAYNMAWWSVDHPYFRLFFRRYVPNAHIPGRKMISGHILDEEVSKLEAGMKAEVKGRMQLASATAGRTSPKHP